MLLDWLPDSGGCEADARHDLIGRRRVGDAPGGEAGDANGGLRVDGTTPIGDHHPDPAVAHPALDRDHRRVTRRIDEHLGVERRTAAGIPQRDIDAARLEVLGGALDGGDEAADGT
jgi:hypothetical protein